MDAVGKREGHAPLLSTRGSVERPSALDDVEAQPLHEGHRPGNGLSRGSLHPSAADLHDYESAYTNHRFSAAEKRKLKQFESLDYLPPNSSVYRTWLKSQPHGLQWDRFFMMASIGATVGIIGYFEFMLIGVLSSAKFHSVAWLIDHAGLFVAWLFNVALTLALVFLATWTVVHIAPAAAGAGVAEVMAYLNGVHMPKIFNLKTLVVKFVSCAAAVGVGLPVGPEGPMIHMGALIGSGLSQGTSMTLGFSTGLFERFRNPRDQRDFVTAGAAIGVAVAFNAPIGGLLFAFEEVASFFSTSLGWQTFVGCMLGVFMLNLCRSLQTTLSGGTFGLFDGDASTVFYEVRQVVSNHVAAVAPAAVIGAACGLAAVVFTIANLKCSRLRSRIIGSDPRRRMAEPLIIALIFVTASMLLPQFAPCIQPSCVNQQNSKDPICEAGATATSGVTAEAGLLGEHYTCRPLYNPSGGPKLIQPYNPLAILLDVPGDDAIRHLLTRGTHLQFRFAPLAAMLAVYFTAAAVIAGSAISTGLFVPMLLIGCLIGRMVGLATVHLAARWAGEGSTGIFLSPSPWAWIDPGVFALFGAAAFMGGTTRLTMSLAVIMLEMSNDVRMLLPVLVAIGTAKCVADAVTPALYHGQLALKAVPYLNEAPAAAVSLDLLPVSRLMASPVVTFRERMAVSHLRRVLRDTTHNGFPVVRTTQQGQVVVGLITRPVVMALLRHDLQVEAAGRRSRSAAPPAPTYGDLSRVHVSPAQQRAISEQQLAVLQAAAGDEAAEALGNGSGSAAADTGQTEGGREIDLQPYVNTSALTVDEGFSAERTYILLRTLGLRHITIVDRGNHPKGMITRKDLLGYRLDEAVQQFQMT